MEKIDLKGKTPFDFFPKEVVLEAGKPFDEQFLREHYRQVNCAKSIWCIAEKQGDQELMKAVEEQFPELFLCCIRYDESTEKKKKKKKKNSRKSFFWKLVDRYIGR